MEKLGKEEKKLIFDVFLEIRILKKNHSKNFDWYYAGRESMSIKYDRHIRISNDIKSNT
jgi:hypothetical protein